MQTQGYYKDHRGKKQKDPSSHLLQCHTAEDLLGQSYHPTYERINSLLISSIYYYYCYYYFFFTSNPTWFLVKFSCQKVMSALLHTAWSCMYAYASTREGRELFIYVEVFSDGKGTGISAFGPA